jgi:hypothetical protein
MTYEEVIALSEANKFDFGMTPEEIAKRQHLVQVVADYNPELARDIAMGPYRVNASPQQAWSRGESAMSNQDYPYSPNYSSPARPGEPSTSSTGPIVAPPPRQTGGLDYSYPGAATAPAGPNGSIAPSGSAQQGARGGLVPTRSAPPVAQGPQWPRVSMGDAARGSYQAPPPPINVNVNFERQPKLDDPNYASGGGFPQPQQPPMTGGMYTPPQPMGGNTMPPWMMPGPYGPSTPSALPPGGMVGGMPVPQQGARGGLIGAPMQQPPPMYDPTFGMGGPRLGR